MAYSSQTVAEFDAAFKAARAFGAITTLLLTSALVLSVAQLFCHTAMRHRIWYSFRLFLPAITVSQLITFSAFGSNICRDRAECRAGGTGIAVILNVFLLVTLSLLVYRVAPPAHPVFQRVIRGPGPTVELQQARAQRHVQPMPEILTDSRAEHLEGPVGLTDDDTDNDELYYSWDAKSQHIPAGNERCTTPNDGAERIDVQFFYTDTEKKTIKTVHHKDGSKTITTVIEELQSVGSSDSDELSDNRSSDSRSMY